MNKTIIVVAFVAFVLVACDTSPRPEEIARADRIRNVTEATITAAAISARAKETAAAGEAIATATAVAWQAKATDTAWLLSIQATQTAVPNQDYINSVQNSNMAARQWAISVVLVFFGSIAFVSAGFAGAAWLRTRSKIVPRGADGQLPGVLVGRTLTDPSRQIGPAVTTPPEPGVLWNVARAIRYIKTGDLLPIPESRVQLTDGGADADHYLEAARVAGAVGIASATFRPDNAESGRKQKIELVKQGGGLLGAVASAPQTRVVIAGDSAIEQIARQLGDRLPPMLAQSEQRLEPNVIEGET